MSGLWVLVFEMPVVILAIFGHAARRRTGSLGLWLLVLAMLSSCIALGRVIDLREHAEIRATIPVFLVLFGPPLVAVGLVLERAHRRNWSATRAIIVASLAGGATTILAGLLVAVIEFRREFGDLRYRFGAGSSATVWLTQPSRHRSRSLGVDSFAEDTCEAIHMKPVKLYTLPQIRIADFLGWSLGGAILVALNYSRTGNRQAPRVAIARGVERFGDLD
jgi:hypothetical protein